MSSICIFGNQIVKLRVEMVRCFENTKISGLKRPVLLSFVVFAAMLFVIPLEVVAQGLLITPRRVVFDGSKNTQSLNLANQGDDTARYVISFVQYRMKVDGKFEKITEPDSGQNFASDYLRFYPREVTLAPREAQLVKVQLRRYSDVGEGEYRSHMYFKSVPKPAALGAEDAKSDKEIAINLVPVFGITIPVIIRKGEDTTTVSITDLSFEMVNDTIPALMMKLNRVGNMSVYGHVEVEHVSKKGKITKVAIVKGLAVYTPNQFRYFACTLRRDVNYREGKLRVVYKKNDVEGTVLAESELLIK